MIEDLRGGKRLKYHVRKRNRPRLAGNIGALLKLEILIFSGAK